MSMPGSLSVGVSSCNQDLIKLRQCLGSVNLSSGGDSVVNDSLEESEHLPSWDDRYDGLRTISNNNTQSLILTRNNCDTNSTVSISAVTSNSEPDTYLRDHSLEAALVTNEMYQEALEEALARLEMALLKNLERQNFIRYELEQGTSEKSTPSNDKSLKTRFKYWQVLCAPYLKDSDGFPYPENEDSKNKRLNNETSPYITGSLWWSKHEQALLYSAVKSNLKRNQIQPLLQKKELYCSKLKDKNIEPNLDKEIKAKIKDINCELEARKKISDYELFSKENQDVDWMQISAKDFQGLRSTESCEIMWNNNLHPGIYKGSWTDEEDKKLVEVVKRHKDHDWDCIARELGSKRTAEQCIKRYNGYLNTELFQKGTWTAEENIILKELVDELRVGNRIPWGKVSTYLESRHPVLIRNHWRISLDQDIKRGPWKLQEDVMLLLGVKKYGHCFTKISQILPGRTYVQCRERYIGSLSLDVSFAKWSIEEDHKLIALAKEKGTRWSVIAEELPGRTANMVRNRYAVLLKAIPDAYERVDLDLSEWPFTLSKSNFCATERRNKVYEYLNSRSQMIKLFAPGKFPRMRQSTRRSRNAPKPKNEMPSSETLTNMVKQFSSDLRDPKHVDFILDETRKIITKEESNVPQPRNKIQYSDVDSVIDNALDSLLLPAIVCRKPRSRKSLALSGKSLLEFDFTRTVLMEALNIQSEKAEASDISAFPNNSLPIKTESVSCLKKNKLDFRNDLFVRGILSTISKHCLGGVNTIESKEPHSDMCILPPMRPSVEAFKLMVMDRNRVADVARLVTDTSVIQKITNSVTEQSRCSRCISRMSLPEGLDCEIDFLADDVESQVVPPRKPEICGGCEHLQKLQTSYVKFKNRFISLFFWPGQMFLVAPPEASIDPSPEQFIVRNDVAASTATANATEKSAPHRGRRSKKRKMPVPKNNQDLNKQDNIDPPIKKQKTRGPKKIMVPVRSSSRKKHDPISSM